MEKYFREIKRGNLARKKHNLQAKFIKFILLFLPFCGA